MVLTFTRAALLAGLAWCFAIPCDAQRLGRAGRGPSDGPRPMLFGFALECSGCTRDKPDESSMVPVWHYIDYPRVVAVAPGGAAERAGIREGDLIVAINGLSLLSSDGARQFSSPRMGEGVRLTVERGGKPLEVDLLPPRMARGGFGLRGERLPREPVPRDYHASVGDATIDVASDEPVVATTDSLGVLTLRIGGTVVLVRPSPQLKNPKDVKLGSHKPKPSKSP